MSQALNGINLESVSVSVEQKEVIRNIVVLKKDTYFFYLLWQGIYFSVIALCFWLPTWIVWMSILVVSPLIARSDRETKWFEGRHKIKVLLLLYTANLKVMRMRMIPTVIWIQMFQIYCQYTVFLGWGLSQLDLSTCKFITTTVRINCRLTTCS